MRMDWFLQIPWDTVHFEKLLVAQVVEKCPALYGNRKFIIMFARAHH
jgi:hypothetical protein